MATAVPPLMDSFTRLIATPSVSSVDPSIDQSNRPVVDLLEGWFSDLGFRTEIQPVSDSKFNLIATFGSGNDGLVLSGHTDTVPYNESAWHTDPFVLTEMDNRLYGLGSSDMKCFFSIVLDVLAEMELAALKKPLCVLATSDEESSMAGAQALVDAGKRVGRYALIGEPTGLKPIRMHKGVMFESIKLTGQAGHACDPGHGRSALEGMHAVIAALLQLREKIQDENRNDQFRVPVPTINLGSIHGGDNPNRICAECELQIDIRLMPGMELEQMRAEIKQVTMQAVDGMELALDFRALHHGAPPFETDSSSEIVRIAQSLTGADAGSVGFATEGPFLNRLGMETVILGPGDIAQAHQANEYIEMNQIEPMRRLTAGMIQHFCM